MGKMKFISRKNIADFSLPLPIYESIYIADGIGKDSEEFSVFVGLNEKMAAQLKTFSLDKNDAELQKYSTDFRRFGIGSYEDWYKKNRTPLTLVHNNTGKLAALVFMGPEPLHEGCKCHTIGWRSYPPFRGKGLMKDFGSFAIDIYLKKFPETKLWAQIRKENSGSLALAQSLGFELSDTPPPGGQDFVTMTTFT